MLIRPASHILKSLHAEHLGHAAVLPVLQLCLGGIGADPSAFASRPVRAWEYQRYKPLAM